MSMATQSTSTSSLWWLLLLEGLAALVIGFFLVISPGLTTVILVQFLGFYWLFSGVLSLVSFFVDHSLRGWKLVGGILGVLAGLVVIRNPLWSALLIPTILVIILAILALFKGGVKLIEGFRGGGFGALVLGILNIIIGIILLGSPLLAALILPFLLGIVASVGGIIAIIAAFRSRSYVKSSECGTWWQKSGWEKIKQYRGVIITVIVIGVPLIVVIILGYVFDTHLGHQLALMMILNIGATSGETVLPSYPHSLGFVSHPSGFRTLGVALMSIKWPRC